MAKRIADKELTDRNWDQEEDTEEAGTFSLASEDVLKNRPIKKAKRRAIGGESEAPGAFKGFKGFALSTSSSPAAAPPSFSGFGNGASFKPLGGLTNGSNGGAAPISFGGFSSPATTKTSTAPGSLTFNGPSSAAPPLALSFNGSSPASVSASSSATTASSSSLSAASAPLSSSVGSSSSIIISSISTASSSTTTGSSEYRRQLTALNCSVRDWITKHVNGNPLCDLQPIFRDYERHLASIEKQYGAGGAGALGAGLGAGLGGSSGTTALGAKNQAAAAAADGLKEGGLQISSTASSSSSSTGTTSTAKTGTTSSSTAAPSLFSFGGSKDTTSTSSSSTSTTSSPAGITFNFGQKVDSSVLSSLGSGGAPTFSFSTTSTSSLSAGAPSLTPSLSTSSSSAAPSLFGGLGSGSGTSAAPFSFSLAKAPSTAAAPAAAPSTDVNGADEDEEPPVPVVREIKEKDAFYSKKCKLFYKKESEFKEKGVGTLHLKMAAEDKLQLLVRADTNLGNILLNIMVPSSMPCSRTGKNNVMVVCVPNPAVDEKNPSTPVPMLIRVKTAEDADELHKLILEKKG
ncbi:nuclear pore complex protein Nup50 [Engraulis encrasicolus]|uniref:nuclear pore complex protein Nup50 n=1 Tax=Engraulis encrasicolus TaxID=184585 RepID=UPI002FD4D10E